MYELNGWLHYAMKAKYLVKLLYMAIYIAKTAIMPLPSFFFGVFSLKIASTVSLS